jgi:hypothetical protein
MCVPLTTAPAVSAEPFIGDWYGEGQPNGRNVFWLDHVRPDGTFVSEYRYCNVGNRHDKLVKGSWLFDGKRLQIVINFINSRTVREVQTYDILVLNAGTQRGRLIADDHPNKRIGLIYTSSRVSSTFKLPDCDLIS